MTPSSFCKSAMSLKIDDVTSAPETASNSGSREEHSAGAVSVASWSRSRYASTTDHGENVEVIQLQLVATEKIVAIPMPQIMGKS